MQNVIILIKQEPGVYKVMIESRTENMLIVKSPVCVFVHPSQYGHADITLLSVSRDFIVIELMK